MKVGEATVYISRLKAAYGLRNGDVMPATSVELAIGPVPRVDNLYRAVTVLRPLRARNHGGEGMPDL